MTRFEFAQKLNGKLYLLSEDERRDIIDEYLGHIDIKMQNGKSEAEAIKDFGDINELAAEILEAYHIDNSKVRGKTLDVYIKQAVDFISRATEKMLSLSTSDIARILVEFIILLVLLNIMRLPIELCAGMLTALFSWMPGVIYKSLKAMINLFAGLLSVGLSFVIIYQFIKRRILMGESAPRQNQYAAENEELDPGFGADSAGDTLEKAGEYVKRGAEAAGSFVADGIRKAGTHIKNSGGRAGDFVINLTVIVMKIMLFICVLLPLAAFTVCCVVGTVLAVVLYLFSGIGFAGVCIAAIGCCVLCVGAVSGLAQILAGGKNNA